MRTLILLTTLLTACDGGSPSDTSETSDTSDTQDTADTNDTGAATVSYEDDIQPIWNQYCTGCHDADHDLPLVEDDSHQALLNTESEDDCVGGAQVPLVVAGDVDQSFLLYLLTGEWNAEVSEDCDRTMPAQSQGPDLILEDLDPDAVDAIRTWIEEGALNN